MLLKDKIPLSYIFNQVKYELLLVMCYGLSIEVAYGLFNIHVTAVSIPITVSSVFGTILSLLLAFRSNQAYDRWWEARCIWGSIVNDSRSFGRQVATMMENPENESIKAFQERMIMRQIAWCYALAKTLRQTSPLPFTQEFLSLREQEYITKFSNKPFAILDLHGKDLQYALKMGWINQFQQVNLDNSLSKFSDSMGKAERIKKTVFPTTYGLYIKAAVWVFILLLPFGLVDLFGFLMVPVLMIVATFFYLIEKTAVQLQDPFENKATDIPLMSISRTIEIDLKEMMQNEDIKIPEPYSTKHFYVL
ncbi:MAG: bestrophin family ion channel [Bacteroidota bacterium]